MWRVKVKYTIIQQLNDNNYKDLIIYKLQKEYFDNNYNIFIMNIKKYNFCIYCNLTLSIQF